MNLTENRLRAIIKEELKGVLGEAEVVQFRPHLEREQEKQIKKQAINSRGTPEHINTLAMAILAAENRIMFSHTGESKEASQTIGDIKEEAYSLGILDKVMARVGEIMTLQQGKREPSPYDYER